MEGPKPETKALWERMRRCSLMPYRFNEEEIIQNLKEIYKLVNLEWVDKVIVCDDIFDERFQTIASASASARASAGASANAIASASAIARASASARASAIARARASARASASASASARASASASAIASASDYDFDWFIGEMELGENANQEYLDIMEYFLKAKEAGLGYFLDDPKDGTLYLCPNPVVKISDQDQFHSDTFPAIEWATQKEYFLNGVWFPEKLWQKVVSKQIPFEDIIAIEDVDQRTQAMKYGDIGKFLEFVNAKVLDTYQKFGIDGDEVNYTLYEIPQGDIFKKDVHYMYYTCPSTGHKYFSGVLDFKSVPEAMAWKQSDDIHIITPKQWQMMVPLLHEA